METLHKTSPDGASRTRTPRARMASDGAGSSPAPMDGARGTRTPDLLGAIQALSQLSYSPVVFPRARAKTRELLVYLGVRLRPRGEGGLRS